MKSLPLLQCVGAAVLLASPFVHAASPALNDKALASLKRMSDQLASAKALTFQARSIFEVPAKNGQFLTYSSTADVALKRPNQLRVQVAGEAPHFDFFYDGATAAAFAPGSNVYSLSKAPATIDAMLPALQKETGIRMATAGLLFSDPYKVLTRNLKSAMLVGTVRVNGAECEHLAFRSEGVNWEIWIETGKNALPRRLAVTFTDRSNFPRTLVEFFKWNLRPALRASDFVFRPPAGSREIPFGSVVKPATGNSSASPSRS